MTGEEVLVHYVAKFILQHIVLHSGFSSLVFYLFGHVSGHIFVTAEDFFTKFGLQVKLNTIFCTFNLKVIGQMSRSHDLF